MTKQRIIYLLALAGSGVFYGLNQEWFSWVLLLAVALFPWLSLLMSVVPMACVRMGLELPQRLPMGSTEQMTVTVTSKLPLPPYSSRLRIAKPMTGERWTMKANANLPTDHCGKLQIQLHRPGVCDYLGLFRRKLRKTGTQTVYVLPRPVSMKIPPDLNKHLQPRWRPKQGGGFAENYEIRQYNPGDNLNKIHWKLSAKVDELMLREPMEPARGLMLLTMDLSGTADELDKKLGQLLWLSRWLLEREVAFEIRVLTANGLETFAVREEYDVNKCIETLLGTPCVREGTIRDQVFQAAWRHHIGGEQVEK